MKIPKKCSISVKYTEHGSPIIKRVDGAKLNFLLSAGGMLEIEGNKDGLVLFAKGLLGLAECERSDGYHVHLDDLYDLNDEGKSITIYKNTDNEVQQDKK